MFEDVSDLKDAYDFYKEVKKIKKLLRVDACKTPMTGFLKSLMRYLQKTMSGRNKCGL